MLHTRPFKFGKRVYMGKVSEAFVLWPWLHIRRRMLNVLNILA